MKKLSEFKIDSSLAKTLAEQAWGRGGTHSYKTNRKGVYYFSCSGHGGYIVDLKRLSASEIEAIKEHINLSTLRMVIQDTEEGEVILSIRGDDCLKRTPVKYNPAKGNASWKTYDYFVFEEDCAWSILEKFTDIRSEGFSLSKEEREQVINDTFNRWYGKDKIAI